MIQQIIFTLLVIAAFYIAGKRFIAIYQSIKLGKPEDLSDHKNIRMKNMLLMALGQKKMFRNLLPAVFHLFIYVAFIITQIELIEIFIDGFTGIHRFFWNIIPLGSFYTFVISFIEVLSALAFVATIVFLTRRNIIKLPRFNHPDLKGFPFRDANIILSLEMLLIVGIFTMNTADMVLHNAEYGFWVSKQLMPLFEGLSPAPLHFLERLGWWGHVIAVFGFLCYLPFSKHLHIFLAFPNAWYGPIDAGTYKGQMRNMPHITHEIKLMLNPQLAANEPAPTAQGFGAKDVSDLTQKSLLDAFSCTECGRCTAACPANTTGKLLSPRKIMMATRDRLEHISQQRRQQGANYQPDGKSLLHDYITPEEVRACTTCNACVEECPVGINPLNIITELRRYLILEESNSPEEWNLMFTNTETSGAVWKMPADQRTKWADELAG